MPNHELVNDWLSRSYSNLERARIGRTKDTIYYEDLCFDCQQSAEKALKALLIYHNEQYPFSHSISRLLEIAQEKGIQIPDAILESIILSDYAVGTRYPGDYEPVTEDEYKVALELAEKVYNWVHSII